MEPRTILLESVCVVYVCVMAHHGKVVDGKELDQALLAKHFYLKNKKKKDLRQDKNATYIIKELSIGNTEDFDDFVEVSHRVLIIKLEVT